MDESEPLTYAPTDIEQTLAFLHRLRPPAGLPEVESLAQCSDVYRVPFLSPEDCDELISLVSRFEFRRSEIWRGSADDYRTSADVFLDEIDKRLQVAFAAYSLSVLRPVTMQIWNWDCNKVSDVTLVRYDPESYYKEHVDAADQRLHALRHISVVAYLSDRFEGGETVFRRQSLTVTPRKGHAIVFPAGITHPHEALPIRNGVKYIAASWLARE